MLKISGVYKIVNKVNGKYYIGSSSNIIRRWYRHRTDLNRNKHSNQYLQNAVNKYGLNNFELIIEREFSDNLSMLNKEQNLLNIHFGKEYCYNLNPGVTELNGNKNPFYGKHHTEESKKKMGGAVINYTGKNNPFYGKSHSILLKDKIRKQKKELYKVKENHPLYDNTFYTFFNKNTNETFNGTRYEFYSKYNMFNNKGNISELIKGSGRIKSVHGWIIKNVSPVSQ